MARLDALGEPSDLPEKAKKALGRRLNLSAEERQAARAFSIHPVDATEEELKSL